MSVLAALAVPASAPAATGGKITGRVTDRNGNGIALGAAYAYRASTGQFVSSAWVLLGGYTLAVPDDADYKVYFVDTLSDYTVPEFFDDKRSLADATPVSVRGGATTSGVNASLATGGRINGRVRTTTNTGVAGATVAAYDATTGAFQTSATTASDGGYTLPAMPAGSYKIYFVGPSGGGYISEYHRDKPSLATADPVTVTAGQTTQLGDTVLAKGGTVSGTVTGDGATPLKDAVVAAYTPSGTFVTSAVTSSTGAYQLPAVPAGDYKILFVGPSGSTYVSEYYDDKPTLAAADLVSAPANGTRTGVDAQLSSGSRVAGRVTNAAGTGVDRVTVFAYRADTGAPVRGVFTKSDGTYSLDLEAGTYKLIFAPPDAAKLLAEYYDDQPTRDTATPITVTSGRAVTGIDATLTSPGVISGKVTDTARTGIAGATVTAYGADGQPAGTATTGTGGTYTLGGLRAGSYRVGFTGPANGPYIGEYHRDRPTLAAADPVTVRAGATSSITADLAKSATFTGKVTAKSGGRAISGATVTALTPGGETAGSATTDASGTYRIGGLAPGSYKLRIAGPNGGAYIAEYYHDQATLAAGKTLTVTSGKTLTVSESLSEPPPPGKIAGYVRGDSGVRAAGVTVTAFTPAGTSAGTATTAADGTYTIDGLPAGTYKVGFATAAGSRFVAEYYRDRATLALADAVGVTAGRTTAVVGSLLERATFTGKVTAKSGGRAISGATVTALTPGGDTAGSATTDATGIYRIGGLTPGSYKLRFAGPDGSTYIAEYYHDRATLAAGKALALTSGKTLTVSESLSEPPPSGKIAGYVRGASGVRARGVKVTAFTTAGTRAGSATTAADGTYTIDGLAAGPYKVAFTPARGSRFVAEFYRDRATLALADAVAVSAGRTRSVIGSLTERATLTGKVTAKSGGRAISGATVTALTLGGGTAASATTDASGTYRIGGLTPGSYKLRFAGPDSSTYATEYYHDRATLAAGKTLTLTSGKTLTVSESLSALA